jgi:hypothetical protein
MYFKDGQVSHAVYGALIGDPAVFKVLRWTEGNFEVNFDGKTTQETTQLNTQGLLMEGLRLLDEANAGSPEPAAASTPANMRREQDEEEDVLLDS